MKHTTKHSFRKKNAGFFLLFFFLFSLFHKAAGQNCIVINEFQTTPTCSGCDGSSSNTGEWIELYNTCGSPVDISCYVLCMTDVSGGARRGDCVTIPNGTTLPANGTFWIGGNKTNCSTCNYPSGTWGSLNLNWHTCSGCVWDVDGDGSGYVGVLNNDGEDITLFNASGTVIDAKTYSGGAGYGSNHSENLAASGGCAAKTVTIPKSSSHANACNGSAGGGYMGSGEGCARMCDGSWVRRDKDGSGGPDFNPGDAENCILPVELISFIAQVENNSIVLQWVTASEINNEQFIIERSSDRNTFEIIGTVSGTGNSNQPVQYQFADENPVYGINYYRLTQNSSGSSHEYSNLVFAEFRPAQTIISNLYPNPVRNNLSYTIVAGREGRLGSSIIDQLGAVLRREEKDIAEGNSEINMDVSALSTGIYFLKLQIDNEVIIKKFKKD